MSKSLVKKSLKILEDSSCDKRPKEKVPAPGQKRKQQTPDLLPDNKKLVKYIGKKGHKKVRYELQSTKQLTMVEAKKRLASKKDRTDENIQKLLRLGQTSMDNKSIEKLFSKANKGFQLPDSVGDTAEASSAFTEEDFKKFEEEYFCS